MTVDELRVRAGSRVVGRLRVDDGGTLSFTYAPKWLDDETAFAISLSLPLRTDEYRGGPGHFFFANLLPEGSAREAVCNRLGISSDNDWALLRAIGGECAGALSVVPPSEGTPDPADYRYERLSDKQLQALVSDADAAPLLLGGPPTRLSLAGAQNKLPVAVLGGKIHLPSAGAPSTHILKLPNPRFPHLTANEAFVMGLAARLELPVAPAELLPRTTPPCLLVGRFDRLPSDEEWPVVRLHQEDLCQALGLPRSRKYEREGGPSLARSIELVRAHVSDPLVAVSRLLEWQAFNIVAGNSDGHGKNLALLYEGAGRIRLAPFYDLLSTREYGSVDRQLAMAVGGNRKGDEIGRASWEALAAELGIAARTTIAIVRGLAERCGDAAAEQARDHRERHGADPILQTLPEAIAKRARRVQRALAPPPGKR